MPNALSQKTEGFDIFNLQSARPEEQDAIEPMSRSLRAANRRFLLLVLLSLLIVLLSPLAGLSGLKALTSLPLTAFWIAGGLLLLGSLTYIFYFLLMREWARRLDQFLATLER